MNHEEQLREALREVLACLPPVARGDRVTLPRDQYERARSIIDAALSGKREGAAADSLASSQQDVNRQAEIFMRLPRANLLDVDLDDPEPATPAAEVGAEARVLANLREYVLHMFTEESLTGHMRLTFAGHVWRIIAPAAPEARDGKPEGE
jgi:hypothetical protein